MTEQEWRNFELRCADGYCSTMDARHEVVSGKYDDDPAKYDEVIQEALACRYSWDDPHEYIRHIGIDCGSNNDKILHKVSTVCFLAVEIWVYQSSHDHEPEGYEDVPYYKPGDAVLQEWEYQSNPENVRRFWKIGADGLLKEAGRELLHYIRTAEKCRSRRRYYNLAFQLLFGAWGLVRWNLPELNVKKHNRPENVNNFYRD